MRPPAEPASPDRPGPPLLAHGNQPAEGPFHEGAELPEDERRLEARHHALDQSPVQRAGQLAMVLRELPERTLPQRDLDGVPSLAAEPGLEPRPGHGLLEQGQIPSGREADAGLWAPLRDQVP